MPSQRVTATLFGAMSLQQNDPTELLEVFDRSGTPTGRAKPRAAIHVDGDWHVAFHCWILRRDGREVLLQRRSLLKDSFAGCWDAAAAGHWRFGETPAEAAREIAEELGIDVEFDQLLYRGRVRSARHLPNGLIDRELHQVYLLCDDRPLHAYRPDPAEVIGLAAFEVSDIVGLASGRLAVGNASEAVIVKPDRSLEAATVSVRREDLVPYSAARLRRMLGRHQPVE
jgi:isopentenyldiphosphate isomerase